MTPSVVILLIGAMVAANCSLVGSYLVLRRLALLGDAISHAVLPGIVVAFLFTESRSVFPMLLGASCFGVLTVVLVQTLNRSRRISEDASIGVVFPALFSLGVILISRYASQVDLDLECVLYGEIAYAPWDDFLWGELSLGPKGFWVAGGVLLVNLGFVLGFFKELKIASFDPELAASLGFSPTVLHYLLMGMVSVTVVGSFESVGAIIVVAMLVVPPSTAFLLTQSLSRMLVFSVGIGVLSSTLGYGLSRSLDCSIAGGMASVSGALFLLAFLLSPRNGLVARAVGHRELGLRLSGQLLMLHLGRGGPAVPEVSVQDRFGWSRRRVRSVARRLVQHGVVEGGAEGLRLTEQGLQELTDLGTASLAHLPEGGAAPWARGREEELPGGEEQRAAQQGLPGDPH